MTQAELDIIQDPGYMPTGRYAFPSSYQLCSTDEAYRRLSASLSGGLSAAQSAAIARLENAWRMPTSQTTPDLYIKIFNDLNLYLFDDQLRNRVHVGWSNLGDLYGRTGGRTTCECCPESRVELLLDKGTFREESKAKVWGTLLHEMLHAYLFVVAERPSSHDGRFRRACRELVEATQLEGLRFGHFMYG